MRLAHLLLALPLLGAAPMAGSPVVITMSNFRFTPAAIRLVHGQRYVLHLVNQASGGHNFVAPLFLAAARAPRGTIDVAGGTTVNIPIVAPAPGRYKFKCGHFMHSTFGMKGEIIVD